MYTLVSIESTNDVTIINKNEQLSKFVFGTKHKHSNLQSVLEKSNISELFILPSQSGQIIGKVHNRVRMHFSNVMLLSVISIVEDGWDGITCRCVLFSFGR